MKCEKAKCYYKYAVCFDNNMYCDFSSAEILLARSRRFSLFSWDPDCFITKEAGYWNAYHARIEIESKDQTTGAWELLAHCSSIGWTRVTKQQSQLGPNAKSFPLTPMHMFFRNKDELKEWLGNRLYIELFAELI
jgi:hypothetical protein